MVPFGYPNWHYPFAFVIIIKKNNSVNYWPFLLYDITRDIMSEFATVLAFSLISRSFELVHENPTPLHVSSAFTHISLAPFCGTKANNADPDQTPRSVAGSLLFAQNLNKICVLVVNASKLNTME